MIETLGKNNEKGKCLSPYLSMHNDNIFISNSGLDDYCFRNIINSLQKNYSCQEKTLFTRPVDPCDLKALSEGNKKKAGIV
jgi:hypothetical protein